MLKHANVSKHRPCHAFFQALCAHEVGHIFLTLTTNNNNNNNNNDTNLHMILE